MRETSTSSLYCFRTFPRPSRPDRAHQAPTFHTSWQGPAPAYLPTRPYLPTHPYLGIETSSPPADSPNSVLVLPQQPGPSWVARNKMVSLSLSSPAPNPAHTRPTSHPLPPTSSPCSNPVHRAHAPLVKRPYQIVLSICTPSCLLVPPPPSPLPPPRPSHRAHINARHTSAHYSPCPSTVGQCGVPATGGGAAA